MVFAPAYAAALTGDVTIANTVTASIKAAAGNILPMAITWLSVFATIQFVVTNIGLLKSGADIEAVIGKFIGSILWMAFCIYVMLNGPEFVDKLGTSVLGTVAPNLPTVGSILAIVTTLASGILVGIGLTGVMALGTGSPIIAVVLVIVLVCVVGVGLLIAIKIFMLQIELGLIVLLAPLSFSFLGLNALKDQGIAPFKSLISLVYRMILIGVVCGAFSEIASVVIANLEATSWANPTTWPKAVNDLLSGFFAFPILGYLAFKSDSIASSLASGNTNLGTSDVAAAAAMGAAIGSASVTGGASAAGGAAKAGQSMADFMKNMGSSSVSNAGQQGVGGVAKPNSAAPPGNPPLASQGGSNGPASSSGAADQGAPDPRRPENGSDSASASAESGRVLGLGSSAGADAHAAAAKAGAQVPEATTSTWQDAPDAPAPTPDSGASAAIGGEGSNADLRKEMARMADQMAIQTTPRKPTFGENFGKVNRHIADEKAATQVSINANASD